MPDLSQCSHGNSSKNNSIEAVPSAIIEAIREALREEMAPFLRRHRAGVKPLLSIQDAAELLGLSVRSVEDLIAAGDLPVLAVGPKGGKRKIAPATLEAYMRRCAR